MLFEIYPAASGGIASWTSGTQSVTVSSGIFNYVLTPTVDWRGKDFWIQLTVNSKVLSPREKITAQLYSLHSKTAEGLSGDSGAGISMEVGSQVLATLSNTGEFKTLSSGTTYYMVPKGAIIMWSGTIANIPAGWRLCDGIDGTPDLTDRFIMGASLADAPGDGVYSSSSRAISASQLPAHNHYASCSSNGSHTHTLSRWNGSSTPIYQVMNDWRDTGGTAQQNSTDSSGSHSHTITVDDTGKTRDNAIDFRPRYYKLAFIMKL
ncbi:MAG: hypothetical protein NT145_08555 [Elusimicrobia bacterium]|nr:hypothetical protein [Elusimicrobiota bacterium]